MAVFPVLHNTRYIDLTVIETVKEEENNYEFILRPKMFRLQDTGKEMI
jgi:hypothetical protein